MKLIVPPRIPPPTATIIRKNPKPSGISPMTWSDLDELAAKFRSCSLAQEEWTHLAHLRVGAWHVHWHGAQEALGLLRERIRKLNECHGTPNSLTRGYHETITAAYVSLIAEFLSAFPDGVSLDDRV